MTEEEKDQEIEIKKIIMKENFPKLAKERDINVQKARQSQTT